MAYLIGGILGFILAIFGNISPQTWFLVVGMFFLYGKLEEIREVNTCIHTNLYNHTHKDDEEDYY